MQCSREQSVNNTQFQDFFKKIDPKSETCQTIKKRNQVLQKNGRLFQIQMLCAIKYHFKIRFACLKYQSYTDISIQFLYKKIWTNFSRLFFNADRNIDS